MRALLQQHPIEVVFIQSASISFCQKKFEVRHSHHQLRVEQKKGSAPNIRYRDNPYLQFSRENFYVRSQ
ncbi:MAG: hypothetical protein EA369_04740 [Bradymonadales bacterium]|nr:MAG: hypothetical protein EA369_04740 [Bradymonadales bacterium]